MKKKISIEEAYRLVKKVVCERPELCPKLGNYCKKCKRLRVMLGLEVELLK